MLCRIEISGWRMADEGKNGRVGMGIGIGIGIGIGSEYGFMSIGMAFGWKRRTGRN
jgi:hypothetical protein